MDPCLRRTIDSLILDFVSSILGLYPLLTLILFPPSIASILAILHQKYSKFDFCSYKLNNRTIPVPETARVRLEAKLAPDWLFNPLWCDISAILTFR